MKLINHVAFVLDVSSSMQHLGSDLRQYLREELARIETLDKAHKQNTKISVYTFSSEVRCLVFEEPIDIARAYCDFSIYGNTQLLDGMGRALKDLSNIPTPRDNHAFLVNVLTDGEENWSKEFTTYTIASLIKTCINRGDFTVSILVPSDYAQRQALNYGIPKDNIHIWETTHKGFAETSVVNTNAVSNYYGARASGATQTMSFYTPNTNFKVKDVKAAGAKELSAKDYTIVPVVSQTDIRSLTEKTTRKPYKQGQSYYLLAKPEIIQNHKEVIVQNNNSGKVYEGHDVRELVGLPSYEVKVKPTDFAQWNIFIQSKSVNRKFYPGNKLLIRL